MEENMAKKAKKTKASTAPYQKVLLNMQKKLKKSFNKLNSDIAKGKSHSILQKDGTEIMMLLGEVYYLTKECKRMQKKQK